MTSRNQIIKQLKCILKGQLDYRKAGFVDKVDCFEVVNDLLLSVDDAEIYGLVAKDPALGVIDWEWLLDSNAHNNLLKASDIIRQNLLGYLLPKAHEIIENFDWVDGQKEEEIQ